MAIRIRTGLTARALLPRLERFWALSADKIRALERTWNPRHGAPVYTVDGRYRTRGWTDWTQGFQYGSALLQFDATDEPEFLELGRELTLQRMACHVSATGVHDHGFNNISTYGNLWRLLREGRMPFQERERDCYEVALKVSGAIQAARWTSVAGGGYIYSFNGAHSLFIDTMRSLRSLAVAHQLGHALLGEQDQRISLLQRLLEHARTTARYNVYYGENRDAYDVGGRVAQEAVFNVASGHYRCPSTQQGYSPFSTWTRGLAWALCGFAEQLEFLAALPQAELARALALARQTAGDLRRRPRRKLAVAAPETQAPLETPAQVLRLFRRAAMATADYYLATACADGIPMWDTGAPNLHRLGDYRSRPADPFNAWEPVDSSAASVAAQGLLRLGNYLCGQSEQRSGARYRQAGLTIAQTLFAEPYLSTDPRHQGLILHAVYHRPNGWDHIASSQRIPNGESCLWGDYHARELALMIWREARGATPLRFFAPDVRISPASRSG